MSKLIVNGAPHGTAGTGASGADLRPLTPSGADSANAPAKLAGAGSVDVRCDSATGVCDIERALAQQANRPGLKQDMLNFLSGLEYEFGVLYAPAAHKGELHGWDLASEFAKARQDVQALKTPTVREFQGILKRLVASAKDYHVGVAFHSSARSTLPLSVKSAVENGERKFFIAHVERDRLAKSSFPYEPGIEVTHFDGRPVGEIVDELMDWAGHAVEDTDRARAEFSLTKRSGARGMDTPDEPMVLTLKDADGRVFEHQLAWNHYSESVSTPEALGGEGIKPHMLGRGGRTSSGEKSAAPLVLNASANDMLMPNWEASFDAAGDPHGMGAKRSFLPRMGEVKEEAKPDDLFDWYIYENDAGQRIGVLRIPS
ncbi:MAG: PDZ domain-containing protein, partial [Myxococcota bacterium]